MATENLYYILSGITQIDTKQNLKIGALSSTIGTGFNTTNKTVAAMLAAEVAARQAGDDLISGALTGYIDTRDKALHDELTGALDTEKTRAEAAEAFLTGAIGAGFDATSTVLARIESIENSALKLEGIEDNAIEVTGSVNKTVFLNIDGNLKVLSQSADGLKTTIQISALQTGLASGSAAEYQLVGLNGQVLGDKIVIPKDQFLKKAEFVDSTDGTDKLQLTFIVADGSESVVDIPLSGLFNDYTAASGVALDGLTFKGVVDGNSEAFLTVGADGFKVSGVQDAIDTAVSGEYTRATGIEAGLRTDVDTVSGQVEILKGGEDTVGSVDYKIKAYDDNLAAVLTRVNAIKTLMEI